MYVCFIHAIKGTIVYVPVENEEEINAFRDDTDYFEYFQYIGI